MIARGMPDISVEEKLAVDRCLREGTLAVGPEIEEFERAFAQHLGIQHVLAVSNGWSAIFLTLTALGIGYGDLVALPTTVCMSVYTAITATGATPFFVDSKEDNYNMDVDDLRGKVVSAIVLPHLRGVPSDIDDVGELGIPIVEDCAQSVGTTYKGMPTGVFGKASIYSFYPTKTICSIDGGAIATNDTDLFCKVKSLRYFREENDCISFNFKLNNINAAVGLAQLEKLDEIIECRWRVYEWYKEFLPGDDMYTSVHSCKLVVPDKYVIEVKDVGRVKKALSDRGVQLIIGGHLLHRVFGLDDELFPHAVGLEDSRVVLPIYSKLTRDEVKTICQIVKEVS